MEGVIVNYRGSRRTQKTNHIVIRINGISQRDAANKLEGNEVVWVNPESKKEIKGIIRAAHGNSGCVRAIFEKGLPGQALGTKVNVEAKQDGHQES